MSKQKREEFETEVRENWAAERQRAREARKLGVDALRMAARSAAEKLIEDTEDQES